MIIDDHYILTKPGLHTGRIWFWALLYERASYASYCVKKVWGVVDGTVCESSVFYTRFINLNKEVRTKRRTKGYVYPTDAELLQIHTHLEKHLMWQALADGTEVSL